MPATGWASEGSAGGAYSSAHARADSGSDAKRNPEIGKDSYGMYVPLQPNIPIDKDSIKKSAGTIDQGAVGDCWLLAAAASLAHQKPELLANNIKKNADGSYTVQLYKRDFFGQVVKVPVTVTPEVIENSVKDANGNHTWLTIYEKAYAQLKGSYKAIDGGWPRDAYFTLTGVPARSMDSEPSLAELSKALDAGGTVVMDTTSKGGENWLQGLFSDRDGPVPDGTVPNHVYTVTKIENGKVHLQNPWGPSGGNYGLGDNKGLSEHCPGTLVLTETEYRQHFANVTVWKP